MEMDNRSFDLLGELEREVARVNESVEFEKDTYTASELFNLNSESIPQLVEPIIPKVGVFTIVGSSDTGKSMLFRQLSLCVARGSSFLDFTVNTVHQKVLFIATEDDNISTGFLLRKQAQTAEGLENIRFHFETENIPKYITEQLDIELVDLIVIDAWSDVFGQNLNDSALIRATLNLYRSLANKYQCAIGFLHHTGKRTQKLAPSKDNILSGQGFEAKMRLVMELRTDVQNSDYKHLCIVKGNYLGKEYKERSYKLFMDPETFLFEDTGERIPFDELLEPSDNRPKAPEKVHPTEISNDIHKAYLINIYKNGEKITYRNLCQDVATEYFKGLKQKISRETSESIVRHLENEGLIIQHGVPKTRSSGYLLNEHIKR